MVYKKIHYYYDGVRIVQEVIETPGEGANPSTFHTEREYVHGPDYVDEFVAQIDNPVPAEGQDPALLSYMLQDANYNVMALVTFPETGGPVVLSQYQYEPYGPVAAEDHDAGINNANENVAGHQGLFFHRLSVGGLSLAPGTQGLYYNRNRWYAPHLGRFLTRDPNGTAQALISALAMNGQAIAGLAEAFSSQSHFSDGMNLYRYLSSSPINQTDPTGLLFGFIGLMGAEAEQLGLEVESGMAAYHAGRSLHNMINLIICLYMAYDTHLNDQMDEIVAASSHFAYHVPPRTLPAFPDAVRVPPKGSRARWKDSKGNIYEWDSQHGTVEKYDKKGKHQGEYDINDGHQTKPPNPRYECDP